MDDIKPPSPRSRPQATTPLPPSPSNPTLAPPTSQPTSNTSATPEPSSSSQPQNPSPNFQPPQPAPKKSNWLKVSIIILVILIVLAGLAFAAYKWIYSGEASTGPSASGTGLNLYSAKKPKPGTKRYQSSKFGLSIDYPSNWQISQDKNELDITSPKQKLTDAKGKKQLAKAVIAIHPKGTIPAPLAKHSAVAVSASSKISYTQPSRDQRGQTYLSYLQYSSTTTHGGLDAVYITGDLGYKYGQTIASSGIKTLDPLVNVSFEACSSNNCQQTSPLTLSYKKWQSSKLQQSVQATLQSIRVKS